MDIHLECPWICFVDLLSRKNQEIDLNLEVGSGNRNDMK